MKTTLALIGSVYIVKKSFDLTRRLLPYLKIGNYTNFDNY